MCLADIAVVAPFGGGWILESLALELDARAKRPVQRIPHRKGLTSQAVDAALASSARVIVFAHHIPMQAYIECGGAARKVLFFGHFYEHPAFGDAPERSALAGLLRQADLIWTNAAFWDAWLTGLGVASERLHRIVRAVDSETFRPDPSRVAGPRPVVGLASQYHHRKNEGFILRAVERRRDVDWVLLGKGWERGRLGLLEQTRSAVNFKYLDSAELGFEAWPDFYRSLDVFVSPSFCEGGPFPVLEAMSSGVWPVCSRTGFAEDFIIQGQTGHVFELDDDLGFDQCLDEALGKTRSAQQLREVTAPWTWGRFGESAAADLEALLAGV